MEAIDKLYETIMEKDSNPIKTQIKSKKTISKLPVIDNNNQSSSKNCCKAGVRYNTIGNAYRAMMENNIEVWLIDEEKDDNIKTHAYSRCLKTISSDDGYCHIHSNTIKNNGQSKVKDFEKDIISIDSSDKTRRIATPDDDYFIPMGKRGAKKKNSINTFTFTDDKNPILLVLNHKNAKLNTLLTLYATQILKNNTENITLEISKLSSSSQKTKDKKSHVNKMNDFDIVCSNNLLQMMNDLNINQNNDLSKSGTSKKIKQTKSSNDDSNDIKFDSDDEEIHSVKVHSNGMSSKGVSSKGVSSKGVSSKSVSSKYVNKEKSDSEESEAEESEEEESESDESEKADSDIESVECVPIKNKNGEELWYNPNENIVYRMSGEDGEGVELGYLKKVHKNHHYIFFERKYYTVVKQVCNNYECVFSNNIFDEDMCLI